MLFIAMADRWRWRARAGAWAVALLGLAASVAGNVGHVAAHDLQSRGTAAVPPLAAFAALWLGLGVLKRVTRQRNGGGVLAVPASADETGQRGHLHDSLGEVLADLADAVRTLAERADDAFSSPRADGAQSELLAELLDAVRGLGERTGDAVSSPVPTGVEHAALIAYRATLAAGNPYSMNQLQVRFGLTRAQVARIRKTTETEPGWAPLTDPHDRQGDAAEPIPA